MIKNLHERGITGAILNLIWKINNSIKGKEEHSYIFEIEESIRQGEACQQ